MSDTAVATIQQPKRPNGIANRSAPRRVTGKLKVAIDAMVWEGAYYDVAAQAAGMTARAIRLALTQPHVLAYLKAQKEVLRSSTGPRNIHRLAQIRDAADNMPAVQAIKLLEQLPDDNVSAAKGLMPGFVVQIVNVQQPASMPHTQPIDANPLIDQGNGE